MLLNQKPTETQANEACAFMAAEVHAPAFFEKLASVYGIRPRTQAEAAQLLQLGAVTYAAAQNGQYKSAAMQAQQQKEEGNPFLTNLLNQMTPAAQPQVDLETHVKQAALKAVKQDELTKTAALVYLHLLSGGEVTPEQTEQPAAT
jgi:hypothetical protein